MANKYTCEIEVTCKGRDLLVVGSIEETITGVDGDGELIKSALVLVENVYPADMADHSYVDEPLDSIPVSWKDTLLEAIQAQAFSDWEKHQENR